MKSSLGASPRPLFLKGILTAFSLCFAAYCGAGALAGDAFPPGGDGVPPGGEGQPTGGEDFYDFGITGMEVIPAGQGLYDVEVDVTIIPLAPPTQPIDVELQLGDAAIADLMVDTSGLPGVICCVSTCGGVTGFTVTCAGECPGGSTAPHVCKYTKTARARGLELRAGESIRAVADPLRLHREIAGGEGEIPNFASAVVPPRAGGDVFHDFGITGMKVTPAGSGLYDVEVDVTIIPEAPPTQPIEVALLVRGAPIAEALVPTAGLGARACCISTCAVVPGFTFTCAGECPGGSTAPRVCSYTRTGRVQGVALAPGSEVVAQLDPDSLHLETAGPEWPDIPSTRSVTVPPQGGGPGGFNRGDANGDGRLDISDAIALLGCLFLGSACPGCGNAADANDDGRLDLSDALYKLGYIFLGGSAPPAPFGACGADPTQDGLDCASYPRCDD